MSDFRILGSITKAYQQDKKLYVSGIASGTKIDREGERMATSAIDAFRRAINAGIVDHEGNWSMVPLRSGHRHEWDDVLGWISEAEVDDEHNLVIVAELDQDNPQALNLYKKLTRPPEAGKALRLGFSVGGQVLAAGEEWDEQLGKRVYVYRDVALKETSVTSMPAYAPSYVHALYKSVDWTKVSGERVELTKAAEWSCHANTELEIWYEDEWDGDAAKESIFSWAGWPDEPDSDMAMQGFLAHDEANEEEKGAFKLPFAIVKECPDCGELEMFASSAGLQAAASRLPQTDIPEDVKKAARTVLDTYMRRMDEDEEQHYNDEEVSKAEDGFKPNQRMAQVAERALKWRGEFNRGGTAVGVARARDISNRKSLSLSTVKRMNSYFARHEVDKKAEGFREGEKGFPSAGRIAWDLWGGDPGRAWATKIMKGQNSMKKNDEQEVVTPTTDLLDQPIEEMTKTADETMITDDGEVVEVVEVVSEEAQADVETAPQDEAAGAVEVAKAATDPQDDVRDVLAAVTKAVTDLAASVSELRERVDGSMGASPTPEVEKSEEQVATDAPETTTEDGGDPVEKAAPESDIVGQLVKAMEVAVANAVAPLQQRIAELEVQPVDKSIAVSKINANDDAPIDPLEMYRRVADQNNLSGSDLLRGAIEIAFRGGN